MKCKKGLLSLSMQSDEIVRLSLNESIEIWVVNLLKSEKLHVVGALCHTI
jgi:hypothetical protein